MALERAGATVELSEGLDLLHHPRAVAAVAAVRRACASSGDEDLTRRSRLVLGPLCLLRDRQAGGLTAEVDGRQDLLRLAGGRGGAGADGRSDGHHASEVLGEQTVELVCHAAAVRKALRCDEPRGGTGDQKVILRPNPRAPSREAQRRRKQHTRHAAHTSAEQKLTAMKTLDMSTQRFVSIHRRISSAKWTSSGRYGSDGV